MSGRTHDDCDGTLKRPHETVIYFGRSCPACDLADSLEEQAKEQSEEAESARDDVADLKAEVERLTIERDELRAELRSAERVAAVWRGEGSTSHEDERRSR